MIAVLPLASCEHSGITIDLMLGKNLGKGVVTVKIPPKGKRLDIEPVKGLRIVEREDEPALPEDAIAQGQP